MTVSILESICLYSVKTSLFILPSLNDITRQNLREHGNRQWGVDGV